jgi:hypothetical protein
MYLTIFVHELISTFVLNVFGVFSILLVCVNVHVSFARLYLYLIVCATVLTRVHDCTCLVRVTVHVLVRVRGCIYSCTRLYLSRVRDYIRSSM